MLIKTPIEIVISISKCGKVRSDVIIEKPYQTDTIYYMSHQIMIKSFGRPINDTIKIFLTLGNGIFT